MIFQFGIAKLILIIECKQYFFSLVLHDKATFCWLNKSTSYTLLKMKRTLLVLSFLSSVACLHAQVKSDLKKSEATAAPSTSMSFEQYCLKNATLVIPSTSKSMNVTGTVPVVNKSNPTYQDYGVTLKENEAQYFTIEGTSNLLKVESLFRLRLMYNSLNK